MTSLASLLENITLNLEPVLTIENRNDQVGVRVGEGKDGSGDDNYRRYEEENASRDSEWENMKSKRKRNIKFSCASQPFHLVSYC